MNNSALTRSREIYASHEQKMERYIDLLLEWNEKINLVSRSVSRETVREHVVHSLMPMALDLTNKHDRWIDSGTGGGLPGVPLAIAQPNSFWMLNDNVRKKMRALDDITGRLGMQNTKIIAKSISLVDFKKGTGIVTKHAFKIDDLLKLLGDKPWKTIIMWKGVEHVEKEIKSSNKKLNSTIYQFDFGGDESFYTGKGLVKIER